MVQLKQWRSQNRVQSVVDGTTNPG